MADSATSRARMEEGKKLSRPDGEGREIKHPRPNPGDTAMNRPRVSVPNVKTNR